MDATWFIWAVPAKHNVASKIINTIFFIKNSPNPYRAQLLVFLQYPKNEL
jgi:hypothetical protein